jgi:hypothetical protein
MSNSRKHNAVQTTVDNFAVVTIKGWVSGSGVGDMTGSMIKGTELGAVVTYPSSSNPGFSAPLPSGSIRVQVPVNSRYNQVYSWHVTMEASGTDLRMNGLATIPDYDIVQYGHNAQSGTFSFGFVTPLLTGSGGVNTHTGHMVGAVPADRINPSSPVATWNLTIFARNTDRKV